MQRLAAAPSSNRGPFGRQTARVPPGFEEHRFMRLLGLPVAARDPVTIITAAQVRLRRWRRMLNTAADGASPRSPVASDRIRRILEARDALLRRTYGREPFDAGN